MSSTARLVCWLIAGCAACAASTRRAPAPPPTSPTRRVILAVFAHADDEFLVSPLLARYAREGAEVHLAIVTRGEKWAPTTNLSPGDAIAALRADEARCAARALGIREPILLPFDDGSLGERVRPPWKNLTTTTAALRKLFADTSPGVVITWGPDGGYGHPEHRLVSALVTQLVQARAAGTPRHLLYVGLPRERVPDPPPPDDLPWLGVELAYLTVQVPYEAADLDAARRAFGCYRSQFPEPVLKLGADEVHKQVWQGHVYLRHWLGPEVRGNDVFTLALPR